MEKGKTLTVLVLAIEITTIAILHAVKINQTEKNATKEISRSVTAEQADSRSRPTYSLAVFK
jgi:hypothetical protein